MTCAMGWRRFGLKVPAASLAVEIVMPTLLPASTSVVSDASLDALLRQRLVEVEKLFNASLAGPLAARDPATKRRAAGSACLGFRAIGHGARCACLLADE